MPARTTHNNAARLANRAARFTYDGADRRFRHAIANVEQVQRARIAQLGQLAEATTFGREHDLDRHLSYEDLAARLPVMRYQDLAPYVEQQRQDREAILCARPLRYIPTSGSTEQRKWIPYTRQQQVEFDAALGPWVRDLFRRYPGLLGGRQYWSLSWLPDDLRSHGELANDVKLFGRSRQAFWNRLMAVPGEVAQLNSSRMAMIATASYLATCRDLRMLSVWSPTFGIGLIDFLDRERSLIAGILASGCWPDPWSQQGPEIRAPHCPETAELIAGANRAEIGQVLWPRLALVSAWDTQSSAAWAQRLQSLLPHADFQGKGLWATEGVVTIPYAGRFVLAVTSHVYEFRCLDSGRVMPPWQLRQGQSVQPIMTTGSGFWRYELEDRLDVTGYYGQAPCLTFRGRLNGCDMVGEKLDSSLVHKIMNRLEQEWSVAGVTLYAVDPAQGRPHYCLLAELPASQLPTELARRLTTWLDQELQKIHHYRVARELGQLAAPQVVLTPHASCHYQRIGASQAIAGARKIEPLSRWQYPDSPAVTFAELDGQSLN